MNREKGLFGPRISRHFGFDQGSTLTVGGQADTPVAITHVYGEAVHHEPVTPKAEAAFSIMVQLAPLRWHAMKLGSSAVFSGAVPAGAVSIVDLEDRPNSRLFGYFDAVQFYVPRSTFDNLCRENGHERVGRLTRPRAQPDPAAFELTSLLLPYLQDVGSEGALFVEHITTAFLAHAVRSYGGISLTPRVRGGLSAWQEKRVKEMLRASIASGASIARLAQECRLSPRYFAAAFKQNLGLPPHRYLTRLRVDEAKHLLLSTELPLAEVATRSGFSSQSHLSRTFASFVGCSPGAWRRACRG